MKSTAMSGARTRNSGVAAFAISTLLLVGTPAALADPCSGVQSDAEFLKATIESTIREINADLYFQRQEDAKALEFDSQCGGHEDGTAKCRSIAADLDTLKSLRADNQTKIQTATQALTYYRKSYSTVNVDLFKCREQQAASGAPAAAPSDAPPPSDSTDWRKEAEAQQQFYGPPADAPLPPYDPKVDLSPPKQPGQAGGYGPSRLNAPPKRITDVTGQGLPQWPSGFDAPPPPRITDLGPGLPDPRTAPETGKDSLEGALSNPVISGACVWARDQSNPDDIARWQQTIQQIQAEAETTAEALKAYWNAKYEEAESSLNAATAALLQHRVDPRSQSLVAIDQSNIDGHKQGVQGALDALAKVDLQLSILHKRIAKATQCLDARKATLDPNSGQQASNGGEPGPDGSGQGGPNSGGGGPQGPSGPARQGGNGPGTPPQPLPPLTITVNAPPQNLPPTPPQPLPPPTITVNAPPQPLPPAALPGPGQAGNCTKYTCSYMQTDQLGHEPKVTQMDVCVPASGDWSRASCTFQWWAYSHAVNNPNGKPDGVDARDACQLPTVFGVTDHASFVKYCKSLFRGEVTEPPAQHADVLPVAPLPPAALPAPHVDLDTPLPPAALPEPRVEKRHAATPRPRPRRAHAPSAAVAQPRDSGNDAAAAAAAIGIITTIMGGMGGGGGGGGGHINPCHR